jgi:hypothetical protein
MALEPSGLALPSISPLPPIEMPDSSTSGDSLERDRSSFLRRSSTSLASHSSFTTAMSSTSAQETPQGSPDRPSSPVLHQSLAPTQNLRKSISVDSFVKRDAPKTGPRPKRTNTDLTMQVPVVQPSGSRDHALQRNRGVSFSTQGDYNTSTGDDLDLEPWPSRRRASLKGKDSQLLSVRPGELKLPPRIPALSSTSSTSSINTSPSNPRDEYRRLHATTSMQSIPGRIANPVLASISGRARSGSLGVKVDGGGKPIFINTQIPVTILLLVSYFRLLSDYSPSPSMKAWIQSLLQWLVLPAQASPQSYARVLSSLASPISLSSLHLRACWVCRLPCVVR